MAPDLDAANPLPPMDAMAPGAWIGTSLVQHTSSSSSSAAMPKLIPADYDSFAQYDPSPSTSYAHDGYPVQMLSHNQQALPRIISHSPDLSLRPYFGHGRTSPTPRVKLEDTAEYAGSVESVQYPSPHSLHAFASEVGDYEVAASSSSYLPDMAPGAWGKSEYMSLESVQAQQGVSALPERHPLRAQRGAPRRQPRRLTTKDEANFVCDIKGCGKLFSRSYNYKAHLETHDENREYPFPCQEPDCSKKFVRKTDLSRHHQSVHVKERSHKCAYCGRMFARKDTLRRLVLPFFAPLPPLRRDSES
jgi:hypothetical protein